MLAAVVKYHVSNNFTYTILHILRYSVERYRVINSTDSSSFFAKIVRFEIVTIISRMKLVKLIKFIISS